jgi:fatty-acyl-CoA synthase
VGNDPVDVLGAAADDVRNVYSAEGEQASASHPDIADVAVIGRPHAEWGATFVVFVTPAEGAAITADAVRRHCRPLIAGFKVPREVVFGSVSRNATG